MSSHCRESVLNEFNLGEMCRTLMRSVVFYHAEDTDLDRRVLIPAAGSQLCQCVIADEMMPNLSVTHFRRGSAQVRMLGLE